MEDNMSNKKTGTIRVLIVEPGKAPYAAEIPAGLEILAGEGRRTYSGSIPL